MAPRQGADRQADKSSFMRFPADRLFKEIVTAITLADVMAPYEDQYCRYRGRDMLWAKAYWRAHVFSTKPTRKRGDWLTGFIGFQDPDPDAWEVLRKQGTLAVKLLYVLADVALGENRAFQPETTVLNTSAICSEVGFQPLPANKGHRPENRRAIADMLHAFGRLRIDVQYHAPEIPILSGPLWQIEALHHHPATGRSETSVPREFACRPGPGLMHPHWRRRNRYLGFLDRRLLTLDGGNRGKWPIFLAGHLGPLAAMHGFRDRLGKEALKVEELVRRIGMERVYFGRRHDLLARLGRALDGTADVGLLEFWNYRDTRTRSHVEIGWSPRLKEEAERWRIPTLVNPRNESRGRCTCGR